MLNAYTQDFNKQQSRKGNLFQSNTKRKKVENEVYYANLVHYIHYNSVHHGFVKNVLDWEHSSYHAYLLSKETKISKASVLDWFGGIEHFKAFHAQMIDASMVNEMEF